MDYLQGELHGFYLNIYQWVLAHLDLVVITLIVGIIVLVLDRKSRARRRAHRILWGKRMGRSKNREAYEKSIISYAITDALEEAWFRGDVTRERADWWYHAFANHFQMDELLPRKKDQKQIKRGIRYRLNAGIHRIKAIIPGPKPGVKVDKAYKPATTELVPKIGLRRSKYASAA